MIEGDKGHRGLSRHRGLYALLIAVVIGLGLATRSEHLSLSAFLSKYAGDALWALMVFLGLAFLLRTRRTAHVALLAAGLSCAVEFSQLYHAPWIDAARRTRLGALTLGDTFAWGDMAAYLIGIAFGATLEWAVFRIRCP
jgi:threonine/homoserine efflux transporter RhtA